MMLHTGSGRRATALKTFSRPPRLALRKLGIVSRDYRRRLPNKEGYRDFSSALGAILRLLDKEACDAALFSLYGIDKRPRFSVRKVLRSLPLKHIQAVFLENFEDGRKRKPDRFVVYYCSRDGWQEYEIKQQFARLADGPDMKEFVDKEMPRRLLGNCCVLLCGESNGVKYSREHKRVEDVFDLRKSIPKAVPIIVNPVHDRMTRFEMALKRAFLSENGRWVISVWNKGKKDKKGRTKDGQRPAWQIFHNGVEQELDPIWREHGIEAGVLDLRP